MTKENYDHIENTLRELTLYIRECRSKEDWDIAQKRKALKKRLSSIVPKPAPLRIIEDEKLNIRLQGKGISQITDEEIEMLINLPGVSFTRKKRKDGRYQGYVLDQHGRTYAYGRTIEEVALKLKHLIRYGTPKKKKKTVATETNGVPTTFTAFANYYFENFRKKKVSELTFKVDMLRFKKYLLPYFNNTPIKKITPLQCQQLLDSLKRDGKGKTADELYGLMSVVFKMAIKHGILSRNPLDVIYHEKHERISGCALTREEESFLKNNIDKEFLNVCMLALYTGLRPNEMPTARIDGDFIVAVNSKRKHKRVEYKKIPIIKALRPYIENGLPAIPGVEKFRLAYKKILPNHIVYDMRTTFYSRCKEFGVAEYALSEYMGHSLGPIANAYTDLSDEYLLSESKKLDVWE